MGKLVVVVLVVSALTILGVAPAVRQGRHVLVLTSGGGTASLEEQVSEDVGLLPR